MPFLKRKRPAATRTTTTRRRRYAKRRRFPLVRAPPSGTVFVKRTLFTGSWVWGTTNAVDYWRYIEYSLNSGFNNATEFNNVFDRYKVHSIKVQFMPRFDNLAGPTTGATPMTVAKPRMVIIKDPYSGLSPGTPYSAATLNTLLEQGGKVYDATRPITVIFRPAIASTVSGGVNFIRAPFLRTTETGIQHRGFHAFIYQNNFSTTTTDLVWDVLVTMNVQFKNLK